MGIYLLVSQILSFIVHILSIIQSDNSFRTPQHVQANPVLFKGLRSKPRHFSSYPRRPRSIHSAADWGYGVFLPRMLGGSGSSGITLRTSVNQLNRVRIAENGGIKQF